MSDTSNRQAEEFLGIADQFRLGELVTESSHPATEGLSEVARDDIGAALDMLFEVDCDVVRRYREWAGSEAPERIKQTMLDAILHGGRVCFIGCGSTGRLSVLLEAIWRQFWQAQHANGRSFSPSIQHWEDRAVSAMSGGDYAVVRSVEGFEDYPAFGRKQVLDIGIAPGDVVFAITEGGETPFVIGGAWQALECGARVYFVYNNPDSVLRNVERSREILDDPRIEKINLTTGPMAITGSTRMQATTMQLCVLITVMEMVLRDLISRLAPSSPQLPSSSVPAKFLGWLEEAHAALRTTEVRERLAKLVALEESVYRSGGKVNYFAESLGLDILTDTTERAPTFCTPSFKKFDDARAAEPWSFLFVDRAETPSAWQRVFKRSPRCIQWSEDEVRGLVGEKDAARVTEIVRRIGIDDLLRVKIGCDGLKYRVLRPGEAGIGILSGGDIDSLLQHGHVRHRLQQAKSQGVRTGFVFVANSSLADQARPLAEDHESVFAVIPDTDLLLDGITHVAIKMLLNALSTCTMARVGRVMSNYMIYVVPSNNKLIDRSIRYVSKLAGLSYDESCRLVFEVIEYVTPRMKADQEYPPVVGLAVMRARHGVGNEEAEMGIEGTRG